MSEALRIAETIDERLTTIKAGTLRFWGRWFGRPFDNCHRLVSCSVEGEVLRLQFDKDEILHVWDPYDATISSGIFQIDVAARVRWEWYYYGRPKTAATMCFEDFTRTEEGITFDTNGDRYTQVFKFDLSLPAVEIL